MTTVVRHAAAPTEDSPPSHVRLPDFLIIGLAKCGTTTLYEYPRRHPPLCLLAEQVHANDARTYQQRQLRLYMTQVLGNIRGLEYLGGLVPRRLRDSTYRLLGRTRHPERLRREVAPPPMRPETRARLLKRFRKPNRRLAALLGRDLLHWDK